MSKTSKESVDMVTLKRVGKVREGRKVPETKQVPIAQALTVLQKAQKSGVKTWEIAGEHEFKNNEINRKPKS